ncbi:MAG: dehydrogenase E1 component subunit alpha/beta [Bacteroidia bacterium]|nr:dehydrogenase E1 component subunit alpha/beta [Bacteroidia bacterium]
MELSTQVVSAAAPMIQYDRRNYSDDLLIQLYKGLLKPRMIEEKMLILLRQNKISKWFSGIGQEAIAVGATMALKKEDYIFPLHRNLGVFTARGVPLVKLFCQWQGKKNGFTKGRDRSFHFGTKEYKIIGMISHLGAMLGVADGTSLASNLSGQDFISLAFSGDGGASEGDFHEAINTAAVWDLPVIFLIENNGYGLSTPSSEQFRCKNFIDKAIGYGIEGYLVDGNNILDVYHTVQQIAEQMRKNRKPVLLEAITFRMRGHEEASGTKYVPSELIQEWQKKDPLTNYEAYLLNIGVLTPALVSQFRQEIKEEIDRALEITFATPDIVPNTQEELADVYAPSPLYEVVPQGPLVKKRFVDAISDALRIGMERNSKIILMGQDIAEYGGVFKVTEGLVSQFGKARVRNTPLCESAIIACGLGLSLEGYLAIIEMQFADFVSCGFNQIVNNLAKTHYRWGHAVSVIIRMPTGAGVAAGPFHSQSNEAWFFHTPGLKLVYPSTVYDAKGLLLAAMEEKNPVIFFEHKKLYRSIQEEVPQGYYTVPLGKARIVQEGEDLTIVAYGWAVHWAIDNVKLFPHSSIEIIDLRTLLPWDKETVMASLRKTGKCLILHEDTLTGGIGAEICAFLQEEMFQWLDAPIMRLGALDTPVPFNAELENNFLPIHRLYDKIKVLLEY